MKFFVFKKLYLMDSIDMSECFFKSLFKFITIIESVNYASIFLPVILEKIFPV